MVHVRIKCFLYIILIFSALAWFLISKFLNYDLDLLTNIIRTLPQVVTANIILAFLFVNFMWKWKILQGWLVPFPNLTGTWKGELHSNWKKTDGTALDPIPVILTIKQSFLMVSCTMRTAEMTSYSYSEGFILDEEKNIQKLYYSYTSKPQLRFRERSPIHEGTIIFDIIKSDKSLVGEYWTQRMTTG